MRPNETNRMRTTARIVGFSALLGSVVVRAFLSEKITVTEVAGHGQSRTVPLRCFSAVRLSLPTENSRE